jgi:hypothetical protein
MTFVLWLILCLNSWLGLIPADTHSGNVPEPHQSTTGVVD